VTKFRQEYVDDISVFQFLLTAHKECTKVSRGLPEQIDQEALLNDLKCARKRPEVLNIFLT